MSFFRPALLTLLISFNCVQPVGAARPQAATSTLQPGSTVERTIKRGETHSYGVSLKRNQFLQLVVEQHGIDVVVRLFAPDGKGLGVFDSPNGTEGPEGVSLIADVDGVYRVVITPLVEQGNSDSGRYEIRILDLRPATSEELGSANGREALKAKGQALLAEVAEDVRELRLPETRVRAQLQTAQLLRGSDEKRAREMIEEAIEGLKTYMLGLDPEDQNYYQGYQVALQLRAELFQSLSTQDPLRALEFLRATRTLTDPNEGQGSGQLNQELQLELSIASQIAAKEPERALRMAEESLSRGYSYGLLDTLNRLRATTPESAAKLASEIATKLQSADLLGNQEAANLTVNLLRLSSSQLTNNQTLNTAAKSDSTPLLNEQEFRALFGRALSAGLSYTSNPANFYSAEKNSAQMLLTSLNSMTAEMQKYAPGRASAVEKKVAELNTPPDPQGRQQQQYQEKINNGSLDEALEAAGSAPREMRDQLYQQVASRAAGAGDISRARQVLTEHITNPFQRQQALKNLTRQAAYTAASGGRIDEALRYVNDLRAPQERAALLVQIVNIGGSFLKKAALLELLGQARRMIGASGKAEDQEQMNTLLEIARAYLRLEPKHCFEILDPLVDQFNSMSEAAEPLNGFGQQFFRDGELMMQNGNTLGGIASQLIQTVGPLAASDFDRAKATADRLNRPEARLFAYLSIAQNAIQGEGNEGPRGYNGRGRISR
jgi:hypothetical protein